MMHSKVGFTPNPGVLIKGSKGSNYDSGEREMQLELAEPTYSVIGSLDTMSLIINDPEDMPTISFLTDEIHISEEQKSLIIPIR